MTFFKNIVRPELNQLSGYSNSTIDQTETALSKRNYIKLDANLSPYEPFSKSVSTERLNQYCPQNPITLVSKLAKIYNCDIENILCTRGSDEAIDLLIRAFCNPGQDSIITCPPTFCMYEIFAKIQSANVIEIPLAPELNYQLNTKAILDVIESESVKIIFIPTPNAPLGNMMRTKDILKICQACTGKAIVVADEAYLEFSGQASLFTNFSTEIKNLVSLRTLSKAYSMAGLRIGSMIADPEIVQIISKIQAPYPISVSSVKVACEALCEEGIAQTNIQIEEAVMLREELSKTLNQQKYVEKVFPSVTNYVTFISAKSEALIQYLATNGFLVRSQSEQISNAVRISVGTPEQTEKLIKLLKKFSPSDSQLY